MRAGQYLNMGYCADQKPRNGTVGSFTLMQCELGKGTVFGLVAKPPRGSNGVREVSLARKPVPPDRPVRRHSDTSAMTYSRYYQTRYRRSMNPHRVSVLMP